jgi:hypothetical protein
MDAAGLATSYVMADKRREKNIHCGLLLLHSDRTYLLDPGYLIFEPLPLPQAGLNTVAFAAPNAIRIEDLADEGVWRLHTGPTGALKHRFDFRKEPVHWEEFRRHWEASHHWPMMRYPVLNRVSGGTQYYLQKNNLLVRSVAGSEMRKLTPSEFLETATRVFGMERGLVQEALGIFAQV